MSKLDIDLLVFDIDGVLIDVSESYRNAIRMTVQLYIEEAVGLEPFAGELVSQADVSALKLAGGFNNDWDLTAALVSYFLHLVDITPGRGDRPNRIEDVIAYLRQSGNGLDTRVEDLWRRKDVPAFAQAVRSAGGGLKAVNKLLGTQGNEMLFASGDLDKTNLVQRTFEEVYLGEEYFRKDYDLAPIIHQGPGLIRREKLIVSKSVLEILAERVKLAVATGRPRNQAVYALWAAGILEAFRVLVAHEDIVEAENKVLAEEGQRLSLSKPHPFALWKAAWLATSDPARCAYIGDTLDDVRAANAAKTGMSFVSIGCLAPAEDKEAMRREFKEAGADLIVSHPDELVDWLIEKGTPGSN